MQRRCWVYRVGGQQRHRVFADEENIELFVAVFSVAGDGYEPSLEEECNDFPAAFLITPKIEIFGLDEYRSRLTKHGGSAGQHPVGRSLDINPQEETPLTASGWPVAEHVVQRAGLHLESLVCGLLIAQQERRLAGVFRLDSGSRHHLSV